jgi:hypothetical protein
VIPEEAEYLIPLLYRAKEHVTHLLTYAAPVTRKMLHFNGLKYYAIPSLPPEWRAPTWLTIELGIFAGRLYFEYEEYSDLREYLGFREAPKFTKATREVVVPAEFNRSEGIVYNAIEELGKDIAEPRAQSFTANPLTFLQEWLAVRRKGQDFVHTPMGYVCQGKPLAASHPFFSRIDNSTIETGTTNMRNGQGRESTIANNIHDEEYDDGDDYYSGGDDEDGVFD